MDWTERAEKAANYLAETDRKIAELKTLHERCRNRKAHQLITVHDEQESK